MEYFAIKKQHEELTSEFGRAFGATPISNWRQFLTMHTALQRWTPQRDAVALSW